jgi:hypothetical protein
MVDEQTHLIIQVFSKIIASLMPMPCTPGMNPAAHPGDA